MPIVAAALVGLLGGIGAWVIAHPVETRPVVAPAVRSVSYAPPQAGELDSHRATLNRYCVTCHNERLGTAGLAFDRLDAQNLPQAPEAWEKVVQKLRSGSMPPVGAPRPDAATYKTLVSWIEGELDHLAAIHPNPGRPAVHRLNRAEYANAIRDLLALEVDGSLLLPPDDSSYGFDNVADVLTFSPGLVERYLSAAQQISRRAINDLTSLPAIENNNIPKTVWQDERMSEDLPFGSRGGMVVAHEFPLDAEYSIRVRLRRSILEAIQGLPQANQIEVRLDGQRIKDFMVGGPRIVDERALAEEKRQLSSGGGGATEYQRSADRDLEFRFSAKAGVHQVGVAFVKQPSPLPEGFTARLPIGGFTRSISAETEAAIESVQIGGPYHPSGLGDTASRRRIFVCRPVSDSDHEACARKILGTLARRAYRRPVNDEDVETLFAFYRAAKLEEGFDAGIRTAIERLLVSPHFLLRVEHDPVHATPGTVYQVSDIELASRVSFFLWSSIPDDTLLDLAVAGKLRAPGVLDAQVRRMLRDRRSSALVTNFVSQWLHLRNMPLVTPDSDEFPDFNESLREDLRRETELFFDHLIHEDRSLLDVVRANYTFLNERLARHYHVPNVYGNHFRRVTFDDDSPRGGLLGQGAILTVSSYPTRTAPTIRGKWVLENLLGAPPPPPPPNVPPLPDEGSGGAAETVRERLERHRKNPVCAGCHARMDPLGLALENFDAVGQWRATDHGRPINASGSLPDGSTFEGPAELRKTLLKRENEIATTFTEKLLTYALGRGLQFYDMPAVRQITRVAATDDDRVLTIVLGIVKSAPFQLRRVP
jgi:hypothetical protein